MYLFHAFSPPKKGEKAWVITRKEFPKKVTVPQSKPRKTFLILVTFCAATLTLLAQNVIRLAPERGDMTNKIQTAIEKVKSYNGRPVIIELQNADYHIYRESSSHQLYHISNTTSEQENPNQTKHIGLWLKNLQNLTIDGKGARIITHGEIATESFRKVCS